MLIPCRECEKNGKDNPMVMKDRRKNDEEYQHLADITDYICAHGHKFRVVEFERSHSRK